MTAEDAVNQDIFRELDRYIQENLPRYISELGALCSRSSTPPKPSRREKVPPDETLQQMTALCKERGLRVETWTSGKRQVLYARNDQHPNTPTLLSYNTYTPGRNDQKNEWTSAMFGLNERNGRLYAQGIADNRAALVARLAALEAWREVFGSVPVNLKFLVEGQTEAGSVLPGLFETRAGTLKADACLWDWGENTSDGVPILSLGQKGMLEVELSSKTISKDADSALAGILPSGAWRLLWALSAIKDNNEDIQIDGFDEDIHVPTHEDSSFLVKNASNYTRRLEERLKQYGQSEYLMGLSGLPLLITEFFTPTANIIGFEGGSAGEGLPMLVGQAKARVDFRLVPDQDPDVIFELLKEHLSNRGYTDVSVEKVGRAEKPSRTSPNHPFARIAITSAEQTLEHPPLVMPLGNSTGPMRAFKEALGDIPIVSAGTLYEGSNRQTPDENIREADFLNHIRFMARLLGNLRDLPLESFDPLADLTPVSLDGVAFTPQAQNAFPEG